MMSYEVSNDFGRIQKKKGIMAKNKNKSRQMDWPLLMPWQGVGGRPLKPSSLAYRACA
jgi:hypothetical protein